jgi:hypothetical protein
LMRKPKALVENSTQQKIMIVSPIKDVIETQGHSVPTRVLTQGMQYVVLAIEKTSKSNTSYYLIEDEPGKVHFPTPLIATLLIILVIAADDYHAGKMIGILLVAAVLLVYQAVKATSKKEYHLGAGLLCIS